MGSRKSVNLFYSIFSLPLILLFLSCESKKKEQSSRNAELIASTEHFSISKVSDAYLLELNELFQGSTEKERYVLYPRNKEKPAEISHVTHYIPIPIESTAINSTTHLGFLNELGKQNKITAAHNLSYAYDKDFNQALASGKIQGLGKTNIDRELLIQAKPEVFFGFAIDAASYQELHSLRKLGQKVVFISEFMEDKPLNKAAWIQIFAAFFGESSMDNATKKLKAITKEYQGLKKLATQAESSPEVMIGLPWKGTWYVSGGNSFQAQYFTDANANYIWKDLNQKASIPLAIESVFENALKADFWLNPGPSKSLAEIKNRDSRFTNFTPYQQQTVFNQNKRMSENGGNDYWESGVVKPEEVLADLIHIFHPQLLPDRELYFYQRLNP